MTGSEASNLRRQKSNESSRKVKSKGSGIRTRKPSGEEEDKESNRTLTKKTKNETDGNSRSESTGNRARKHSEEEEDKETNRTLFTKDSYVTGGSFKNKSTGDESSESSEEDEDKESNRSLSSEGSSTRLGLGRAVVVSLAIVAVPLIVAACAGNLDCGAFYDSVKASINVNFSDLGSIFDLIMASTGTGFCNPHKNKSCDEFLLQKIKNLGLKYSDQSSDTWLTLFAAAHDHVSYQPDPQRPIVIMVYRLKNGSRVTEILEDIAEVYDSVLPPWKNYGNITIDGKSFTNSSPEETQKQIQDMLENGFEKEAHKVAVVYDFDKLPSCSVLTFHNYCNNEDAPHKNVAIILTVTGTDENLPSNPKSPDLEEAVSKLLHEKWKDCPEELPPGKIDAMLSRVANNVILLR